MIPGIFDQLARWGIYGTRTRVFPPVGGPARKENAGQANKKRADNRTDRPPVCTLLRLGRGLRLHALNHTDTHT